MMFDKVNNVLHRGFTDCMKMTNPSINAGGNDDREKSGL
jgi:hypothetical protein